MVGQAGRQVTGTAYGKSIYPRYDAAELGLTGFWYPVVFSASLGRRPLPLTVMGERVVLVRDRGRVHALADRCPHRGIPLSEGRREFPGTLTCAYHGWTFDLASGRLVAVLTDGPDSGICGRAAVRTYPVAERAGLVWIYMGEGTTPAVPALERDVPAELLRPDTRLAGRISERAGDWRHAAENGFDEGHARYLHRRSLWMRFRQQPAWAVARVMTTDDGRWLTRQRLEWGYEADYPGVGRWPRVAPPFAFRGGFARTAIRLPGALRVQYRGWTHFEWYVPTTPGRHRYVQLAASWGSPAVGLLFRLRYWAYLRWLFHVDFNNQDKWMVRLMETPPEVLYRPDAAIVAWRRLCEGDQGGAGDGPAAASDMGPAAACGARGGAGGRSRS